MYSTRVARELEGIKREFYLIFNCFISKGFTDLVSWKTHVQRPFNAQMYANHRNNVAIWIDQMQIVDKCAKRLKLKYGMIYLSRHFEESLVIWLSA